MPLQWRGLSERTLAEMAVGAYQLVEGNGVKRSHKTRVDERAKQNWRAADMGQAWLGRQFPELEFATAVTHADGLDVLKPGVVTLSVYRKKGASSSDAFLFKLDENADEFVSETLLTKIMLVAG